MNFQTIIEELDRLYEEDLEKVSEEEAVEEEPTEEAEEDADIEIVDDSDEEAKSEAEEVEASAEEEPAEEEVKLVLECANCGALVIKAEADVEVDEETSLANIEEECKYCEEADGYNIIGTLTPYGVEDELDEGLFGIKTKKEKEAERARQEEEERKQQEDEKRRKEQERQREIENAKHWREVEKREAEERRRARNYVTKSSNTSSPSNTPYVGVNYSGGDYF